MVKGSYKNYRVYEVIYGARTGRPLTHSGDSTTKEITTDYPLRTIFLHGVFYYTRILDFKRDGAFSVNLYRIPPSYARKPKLVDKISGLEKAVIHSLKKNSDFVEVSLNLILHNHIPKLNTPKPKKIS